MRRRRSIDIDLTPLLDVVFILLIFFMLSSTFKKNESILSINLPASDNSKPALVKKGINISLSSSQIAINDEIMSIEEAGEYLSRREIEKKDEVFIRIDKDVDYQRMVLLFDILNKYGLDNMILVLGKKELEKSSSI